MAEITPTRDDKGMAKAHVLSWLAIDAGNTGSPTDTAKYAGHYADKSVQIAGTLGSATVTIEGTNDGVTWHTLTDPQGNALSFTAAGLKMVIEATWKIRPKVTGGDVTTAVDVHLLMKEV